MDLRFVVSKIFMILVVSFVSQPYFVDYLVTGRLILELSYTKRTKISRDTLILKVNTERQHTRP